MASQEIRDLLYLDFDKAASIWSQLQGGLRERISITEEAAKDRKANTRFGIPKIAEVGFGVDYADKRSTLESRILHHDILAHVDKSLTDHGLVADLTEMIAGDESSADAIRDAIGSRAYLKAQGTGIVEDYRRMLAISEKFNEIIKFIGRSQIDSIKKSSEYRELTESLDVARREAEQIKDRNQRAIAKQKVKSRENQVKSATESVLTPVDSWLIDGIRLLINTFMNARINFRLYPFHRCPAFQVVCNLKRDCFVDQDLEHLLYGYGNRPNVPLTVFGLITSIPSQSTTAFDPMAEFEASQQLTDKMEFEKAFRVVFGALDNLEDFMRYSRYPNVTIHPIAVYRSFKVSDSTKQT